MTTAVLLVLNVECKNKYERAEYLNINNDTEII